MPNAHENMISNMAQMRVSAAGRTDKGVSAHGQVITFYSWQDLAPDDVLACINAASPATLRAWHAQHTPRSFHATWQVPRLCSSLLSAASEGGVEV